MTVNEAPRVLFCAFAEVPGTTSAGTRTAQWLSVFGTKEMDALAVKGVAAAHIQRLGGARMLRVPNTSGKTLLERLSTYARAVQRQLAGEPYDLVWCSDLFSAGIVAPLVKGTAPIIVEVSVVPSQSRALLAAAAAGGGGEADVKKSWRDAEKAAIRAATRVIVPSRHSAKLIAERIDPRVLLIVQRSVDRSVFSPPSVEIAIDDERLVLVFGGREGGARTRAGIAIAQALAITLPSSVRIGLLGAPSPADPDVKAALGRLGLGERIELVDADSDLAVTGALSLAHVVVVPSCAEEDAEPFALPHRALEAMACGRAVVVTGAEGCFKEQATPGEHVVVVPAKEPRRVADAVEALLDDPLTRASLGRAAARHVERSADLLTRSQEVQGLVADATKVKLRIRSPRSDDLDTSSRSLPAPEPPPSAAVAAPPVVVSSAASSAAGSESGPVFAALGSSAKSKPSDTIRAPSLSVVQAVPTVRMEMPNLGSSAPPSVPEAGAMWDGDTFLEGNLDGAPLALQTNPDAARVRAAMIVSSDAQSKAERSAASGEANHSTLSPSSDSSDSSDSGPWQTTSSPSSPLSALSESPRDISSPSNPAVPTSIIVQAALESKPASPDPWASDTIADGTPIETGRDRVESPLPSSSGSSKPRTKRSSFLVEASGKVDAKAYREAKAAAQPRDDGKRTAKVPRIVDDQEPAEAEEGSDLTMEDQPLPPSSEE